MNRGAVAEEKNAEVPPAFRPVAIHFAGAGFEADEMLGVVL